MRACHVRRGPALAAGDRVEAASWRSSDMRLGAGYSMNVRKQNEKQPGYTNLTRLKTFVNLQFEIDSLRSSSPLIFELRNERILS